MVSLKSRHQAEFRACKCEACKHAEGHFMSLRRIYLPSSRRKSQSTAPKNWRNMLSKTIFALPETCLRQIIQKSHARGWSKTILWQLSSPFLSIPKMCPVLHLQAASCPEILTNTQSHLSAGGCHFQLHSISYSHGLPIFLLLLVFLSLLT